jgi:DNA (cytosine-5)-methyltransferase 1
MPGSLKVIDLFSGVGGLSLGAVKSGFKVIGAVENDHRILASHKQNFPNVTHVAEDVSRLTGRSLASFVHLKGDDLAGIIGGPPCQGFSSIGKRNLTDNRNLLFLDFFRLVSELKPGFYLAENVPGILQSQYSKVRSTSTKLVEKDYQILEPIKIVAKDFGAATTRTRIFFIGVRKDIKGFDLLANLIDKAKSKNPTVVRSALAGLPVNILESWTEYKDSWRSYDSSAFNSYVESLNLLVDGLGDATSINRYIKEKKISGCFGTQHTKEVAKRFHKLKPGEQDSVSKAVRLKADGFCPTLRAGTDNTRGSYQAVRPIHYLKPRVITPREAARLQGFPDWFQFHETKWHSFRQIGNSVCPIVAEKVLSAIKNALSM